MYAIMTMMISRGYPSASMTHQGVWSQSGARTIAMHQWKRCLVRILGMFSAAVFDLYIVKKSVLANLDTGKYARTMYACQLIFHQTSETMFPRVR
jgi:hypothetical protein